MYRQYGGPRGCGASLLTRLLIGLVLAGIALFSYFSMRAYNPITQQTQHISLTPDQEVTLGLQAAPEMEQQYGGLANDPQAQATVDAVCKRIVDSTEVKNAGYPIACHLLADPQTVNAFALPGGQVFITEGIYHHLTSEGQLAGVLGHEIGHVVARHAAEQIAQTQLTQGLTGAVVAASYDPNHPNSRYAAEMAILVGKLVNLKYSRNDESQADTLGVRFMSESGYDPRSMLKVMQMLDQVSQGGRQPDFLSTHPNPQNRMQNIQQAIDKQYPQGVPAGLQQ